MLPALILTLGLGSLSSAATLAPAPGSRESQLQDLAQLRRFVALDAAYSAVGRARALQAIGAAEAGAGTWSPADFELRAAGVAALADNGHSTVWSDARSSRMNRLPIRLLLLADGVFVVRAQAPGLDALGMRVEAMDGIATAEILRRLRVYRGGPDNLRDFDDVSLLESPQLLHAADIARSDHEVTLTLSDQGRARDLVLPGLAPVQGQPRVRRLRYLSARPIGDEDAAWHSAFQGRPIPLWLQQPDQAFRLAPLPALNAMYLQLKTNADADDGEKISAFLDAARRTLTAAQPENVILDMRFDGGGDYTKTSSFMSDLPKMTRSPGRVFVITHTTTFSAGISSVGFLKQAAPAQVTIVGEPNGDRLIFYGEPRHMTLPNSGIGMSYATGLHDYLHGCRWFGPCYWLNWIFPISVPTLAPDLAAPLSFRLLAGGRDPAIEAIGAAVRVR
jgi:hypothetical protein